VSTLFVDVLVSLLLTSLMSDFFKKKKTDSMDPPKQYDMYVYIVHIFLEHAPCSYDRAEGLLADKG
jgi:hypothetical protein